MRPSTTSAATTFERVSYSGSPEALDGLLWLPSQNGGVRVRRQRQSQTVCVPLRGFTVNFTAAQE